MPVTEIEIYEALKDKIGEDSAKTLLEFIDLRVEKEVERKKDILATKQNIAGLEVKIEQSSLATKQDMAELRSEMKEDIAQLRSEMKQDIAELRSEMKQDMAELRSEMKQDIAQLEVKIERVRADLIRWMFIFWAGQIGALIAILALFFK